MRERSKSMMLLLEITIMLLVFAICAGVCLRLFAGARTMSQYSEELTGAAMWAQSAADAYKAAHGDIAAAAELIGASVSGGKLELWLDGDWEPGGDTYLVTVDGDGGTASVTVTSGDDTLYALDVEAVIYG